MLDGQDVRLLHTGQSERDMLLVAMKGELVDKNGESEKIVELVQTAELVASPTPTATRSMWDEWDMQ